MKKSLFLSRFNFCLIFSVLFFFGIPGSTSSVFSLKKNAQNSSSFSTTELWNLLSGLSFADQEKTKLRLESLLRESSSDRNVELLLEILDLLPQSSTQSFVFPLSKQASASKRLQALTQASSELKEPIFLNAQGYLISLNDIPVSFDLFSKKFFLLYPSPPFLDLNLPILPLFAQILQYPSVQHLQYDPRRQQVFSTLSKRNVFEQDISELSFYELIELFSIIFPGSKIKTFHDWRLFGTTSIKRELQKFFREKNTLYQKYQTFFESML